VVESSLGGTMPDSFLKTHTQGPITAALRSGSRERAWDRYFSSNMNCVACRTWAATISRSPRRGDEAPVSGVFPILKTPCPHRPFFNHATNVFWCYSWLSCHVCLEIALLNFCKYIGYLCPPPSWPPKAGSNCILLYKLQGTLLNHFNAT
jgi:hypothetical protein